MNSVYNEAKMPKEEKQRYMKIQRDRWLGDKHLEGRGSMKKHTIHVSVKRVSQKEEKTKQNTTQPNLQEDKKKKTSQGDRKGSPIKRG